MFSSIPCLYVETDANSFRPLPLLPKLWPPKMSLDIAKYPDKAEGDQPQVGNQYSEKIFFQQT